MENDISREVNGLKSDIKEKEYILESHKRTIAEELINGGCTIVEKKPDEKVKLTKWQQFKHNLKKIIQN